MTKICLTLSLVIPATALAWGERGHDVITRAAVRLVADSQGFDGPLAKILLDKEQMLGHLANTPDIVWRNGDKKIIKANAPTHFIDLELLESPLDLKHLPPAMAALRARHSDDWFDKVGTAPWRIEQLQGLLQSCFSEVKKVQNLAAALNPCLSIAGILSHFAGDLTQPQHTAIDYDGWEQNQGGLHFYYEVEVVNALPLGLDEEVFQTALKKKPARALTDKLAALSPKRAESTLDLAFALALQAHEELATLHELDRAHALLEKSKNGKQKIAAKRKAAHLAAPAFHDLIVTEWARAADVLASLWLDAWQKAGSPDLRGFQSYDYALAPAFIEPNYLK